MDAREQAFSDSLQLLRDDYRNLRLPTAFARARRLQARVARDTASLPPHLRAELYQHLACLHTEYLRQKDSVRIYTQRAEGLIPGAAPWLRARQALCWAYVSYLEWAHEEMDLHAAYGIELLGAEGKQHPELLAALNVQRGRARKKTGGLLPAGEARSAEWRKSEGYFRAAMAELRSVQSPRLPQLYEELGLLVSRQEARSGEVRRMADTIAALLTPAHTGVVHPDRLRGFLAAELHRADSVVYFYERLRGRAPFFTGAYPSEYLYNLREAYRAQDAIEAGIAVSRDMLVYKGCCPPGTEGPVSVAELAGNCAATLECPIILSQLAQTLLEHFFTRGGAENLHGAHLLAMGAVDRYGEILAGLSDDGAFNQSVVLGDRIINVAIRAAYAYLRTEPTDRWATLAAIHRTMEFGKGHSLVTDLTATVERAAGDGLSYPDDFAAVQQQLRECRATLFAGEAPDLAALDSFYRLARQRDSLQLLATVAPAAAVDRSVLAPYSLDRVQQDLSAGSAYVEYLETTEEVYGLYVDSDTVVAFRVGTPAEIDSEGFTSRCARERTVTAAYRRLATDLYDRLLGPVSDLLCGHPEVLLSPSASLQRLPFAALIDGSEPETYLVQRHTLRYIDNWRSELLNRKLLRLKTNGRTERSVGVWTHPDLEPYLGRLPEVMRAAGIGRVGSYGGGARVPRLDTWMREYDVLHFSVHARSHPTLRGENYLSLSQDRQLRGTAIAGLDLRASLVVLAACSTDRGATYRREGTYSLRRSFHQAGVPDVISSVYDIPAAATARVMGGFYRELAGGRHPATALAEAQRGAARGDYGDRYRAPLYWAGVVLR